MIRLAKNGLFISPQGEGSELGVMMQFIRLAGCDVMECPLHPKVSNLCDTDWSFEQSLTAEQIMEQVPERLHWLCITGGEPAMQMQGVERLVARAHERHMRVNLQTSGHKRVPDIFDWLTVSPKCKLGSLKQKYGNELKLVYTGQSIVELCGWVHETKFHRYYLQPLWKDGACNHEETLSMVRSLAECGMPWRMGIQAHKYWGVA